MGHSLLSPSAAHRWAVCTASVAMCKDCEEILQNTPDEGTLAHELAAAIFIKEAFAEPVLPDEKCANMLRPMLKNIRYHDGSDVCLGRTDP